LDSVDQLDGVLPVNQARSRNARDRLLQAGERVFAKLGYDAAHVSDIAQAADCSVGSFYRRFRDKEAFFKALHQRFTERNLENAARFFAMPQWQGEPTAVMVRTLIENTAGIMRRNHGFFRALFQRSLAGAASDSWPRMRAGTQRQGELLADFLRARGEGTHENLTDACIFALRSVDGVLVHRLLNDLPAGDDAFALDSLSRMALSFLGIPDVPETERKAAGRRAARSGDAA
jgi:AcrR family transcriptional regulator